MVQLNFLMIIMAIEWLIFQKAQVLMKILIAILLKRNAKMAFFLFFDKNCLSILLKYLYIYVKIVNGENIWKKLLLQQKMKKMKIIPNKQISIFFT